MTHQSAPKPIELLKPGTHTDSSGRAFSFTAEDLAALAEGYDPKVFDAPVVVGHPKAADPAYGWIEKLEVRDDGTLLAWPGRVAPEFAEAVKLGHYRKVSGSFYPPAHAGNPKPGGYYLRHVGFLGAAAPAVKGLAPVELAGDEAGCVTIEFAAFDDAWTLGNIGRLFRGLREFLIDKFSPEDADRVLSQYDIDDIARSADRQELKAHQEPEATPTPAFAEPPIPTPTPDDPTKETDAMSTEDKERLAALEAENAKKDAQLAQFAEREAQARRDADTAFIDGLVTDGCLAPGRRDDVLSFMESLGADQTVDFSEQRKLTPRDFFRDLLAKGGRVIDLAEHSAGDGGQAAPKSKSLAEMQAEHYAKGK
jgi:hypothetical protein